MSTMKKISLSSLIIIFSFVLTNMLPAYSVRALNVKSNYELVLNIPTKKLLVFNKGVLEKEFPVGVGKALTPTPLGEFRIVRRIHNPAWVNPYRQSKVVKPGAANPIGQHWLGFAMNKKKQEFGFHSTSDLNSVGKASTHGCVRLYPSHMKELFSLVEVGVPVHVIYNPVEVKEYENKLFIRVYPDIYKYMDDTQYISFAKNQLSGANLVKKENLTKAINNKDEKDYFIGWTGADKLNDPDAGITDNGIAE